MADEQTPEAAETQDQPKKGGLLNKKMIIIIGAVTVIEGVTFFAASKIFGGGPQVAYGEEAGQHVMEGQPTDGNEQPAEIQLVRGFRAPNRRGGRPYIFDMDVAIKIPAPRKEEFQKLVDDHKAEIEDRIARIVRAAEPAVLYEPELKTLRMQIRQALGEIVDDPDAIREVLIPRCVPIQSD